MNRSKPLLLIVEDETAIQEMLKLSLEASGFATLVACDCKQAQQQIIARLPNLIILDWMLPGQSGVDYLKALRNDKLTRHVPIILLTAKAEEENKIIGLNSGADDYVTKPFSPRELITRVKAVLRRGPILSPDAEIQIKDLTLNIQTRQVSIGDEVVYLSPKLFALLHFFMTHQNKACSREQLLNHVWGLNSDASDRVVDVYVRRLRKSLQPFGYDNYIHTVHAHGYRFMVSNE